jgi:hypothetical protein
VTGGVQPSEPSPELDVVLAISDAPAMAAYHDTVVADLQALAAFYTRNDFGLHLAVVSDDPGSIDSYLIDLGVPWFFCPDRSCRTRNYDGTLGDAIVAAGGVPADGAASPPLLARVEHALDNDTSGFLARNGNLVVLLVGVEDDGSAGDPAGYAERIDALVPPYHASFAAITGATTPRIDAFLAAQQPSITPLARGSIDGAPDAAFTYPLSVTAPLSLGCLRAPADIDDCVVVDVDTPLPHCVMAAPDRPDPSTPLPCFWIKSEPECEVSGLSPVVERASFTGGAHWFDAHATCACE